MGHTNLRLYTIQETDTIEEALARIEDGRGRVTGTLSDGDIRKAILNRRLVSTKVRQLMNLNYVWLSSEEVDRAPELFERHHIFLIPVIGKDQELLDVLRAY
jgi:CBS domain-containing protein